MLTELISKFLSGLEAASSEISTLDPFRAWRSGQRKLFCEVVFSRCFIPDCRVEGVLCAAPAWGGFRGEAADHEVDHWEVDHGFRPAGPRRSCRRSKHTVRNRRLGMGSLDAGTRSPMIGRFEAATEIYGRKTGFTGKSGGEYREFRLDVDDAKGTHINVMTGKGASVRKWAIRWPGTSVTPWLRRNT